MEIVLIAAQSLDGFITRHDTPGAGFTSAEDKAWFPGVLREFDANRKPGRRRVVLTRQPEAFAEDAMAGILEFTAESPAALVQRLAAAGHRRCALLGGGEIHRLFLAAGLVDQLWITVEPRLFGSGTPLVGGRVDIALTWLSTQSLGASTQLLRYAVRR
jgi:dihydrofolate reductase